jgi:3-deoxy-7-phosphoheptulonate synthase
VAGQLFAQITPLAKRRKLSPSNSICQALPSSSQFRQRDRFMQRTSDINVLSTSELPSPAKLFEELPRSPAQSEFITKSRENIHRVIFTEDKRLLLIIGPCSIHDLKAGREYAQRLASLAAEVSDRILVVMRVYFEKPRTTVGWKGLIMDPHLDGTNDIATGLRTARKFLREVLDIGLPTATELLDPITPQYISDLISWSAIGARTTESQTHRQMASGLSMPLGFKNGTDGTLGSAVNAIKAAAQPQTFLGVSVEGRASAVVTAGNPNCHIVLRGGSGGPNYSAADIEKTTAALKTANLLPSVLVDCSHANSAKKPEQQPDVMTAVINQITAGNDSIIGAMVESNLFAGSQSFPQPKSRLKYGISITDGCIDWPTTEKLIRETYTALAPRFS